MKIGEVYDNLGALTTAVAKIEIFEIYNILVIKIKNNIVASDCTLHIIVSVDERL